MRLQTSGSLNSFKLRDRTRPPATAPESQAIFSSLRDNRPMLVLAERLGFKALREESGEIIMQALNPADRREDRVPASNVAGLADARGKDAAPRQVVCAVQMHKGRCTQ